MQERRREQEAQPSKRTQTQKILMIVASILAVVLAITLFRSILDSFDKPTDQYVVKSVLGLTVEEAQELDGIKDVFTIVVNDEPIFSEDFPVVGTIAKQDPKDGVFRKGEKMEIQVWLSAGKDVGQMIDVVTNPHTFAQAKSALKVLVDKYDLKIEEPTEESKVFHDEVEAGYVVSTIPAAGEDLEKGSTVQFVISKGPELKSVTVRNYVGLTLEKARAEAAEQGLVCTDADVEDVYSERPGGEVVWQSLPKDSEAIEGDTIKFHVSSGLAPASIQLEIPLPRDRDQVHVEVFVGDEEKAQFDEKLNCADEFAYVTLTGNGSEYVKVYFDDLLNQAESGYHQFG